MQPHFLSVCGDSVSDAHLASRRYSDSLSLSLSLSLCLSVSHAHSLPLPSQIRAVSTFLLVSFVSKIVRLGKREALSNPSTNYSVIESTTSSAHWRSTHRHAWQSAKTPTDPRKVFPGKQTSKILAFLEKEVYFWDSWRLPWAGQTKRKQTRQSWREMGSDGWSSISWSIDDRRSRPLTHSRSSFFSLNIEFCVPF